MRQEQVLVEIARREFLARRAAVEEGLPVAHLAPQLRRHRTPARQARVRRARRALREPFVERSHLGLRQGRQSVGHAECRHGLGKEFGRIAVGRAVIALADRLLRLHGRMPGPEIEELHQQRAGRLGAARHAEEALGAPIGDAVAVDVEPGGGDAAPSRAVIDVELGGAARQARIALQIELARGIEAAVAGDAAAVEDRLDAGAVVVVGGSGLRMGALVCPRRGMIVIASRQYRRRRFMALLAIHPAPRRKPARPRPPRQVVPRADGPALPSPSSARARVGFLLSFLIGRARGLPRRLRADRR